MLTRSAATLATLLVLTLALRASASVVLAYDLPTLVRQSEHVVDARVVRTSSRYLGSQIVTDVELVVNDSGKGGLRRGQTLALVLLGGTIGDLTMRVEGAVGVSVGDEGMFFLERRGPELLTTSGLSQGLMRIAERDGVRTVFPGGAGLVLVRRDASGRVERSGPAIEAPMSASALLDRVRALHEGPR